MDTYIVVILMVITAVVFFGLGWGAKRLNVITISDTFKPSTLRSQSQQIQDAVLQLKNELAATGALKREALPDGFEKVSLKVVL